MNSTPLVSVLIVNYRSSEHLRTCLAALAVSTARDSLEVIVVDNDAESFPLSEFQRDFPLVRFLPQDANTTFTGGNNRAFDASSGDFILLLNPDTQPEPEAIERARDWFNRHPVATGVGAWLYGEDGSLQRYYRRIPTLLDVPIVLLPTLLHWTPRGRRYLMADESFTGLTRAPQPPGAFLMVRRPVDGPLLDPGYFNLVSDVELCDRLGQKGEVVVSDEVRCMHVRGGAGLRTADPVARLRLFHDLTWGVRRYYRKRVRGLRLLYVEAWIAVFWILRLVQAVVQLRGRAKEALGIAAAAMAGKPPRY